MVIDYSHTVNCFMELNAYLLSRIDDQINDITNCKIYSTLDLKFAYYQIPLAKEDCKYTAFEANNKLHHYCRLFGECNRVSAFQRILDKLIKKHKLKNIFTYVDTTTVTGVDQNNHDKNFKALLEAAKADGFTFNESKSVLPVT